MRRERERERGVDDVSWCECTYMYIYIYVRVCVCVSCLSLSICVCAHVTLQEYNIEKMQLVEAEKGRIRKEYERKEGQVEVLKKMYVFSLSTTSCVCVCVRGEERKWEYTQNIYYHYGT